MRDKFSIRSISFLVISGLLADPSLAAGLSGRGDRSLTTFGVPNKESLFTQETINLRSHWVPHLFTTHTTAEQYRQTAKRGSARVNQSGKKIVIIRRKLWRWEPESALILET